MQRELNPQIFGTQPRAEGKSADPISFLPNEVKNLEAQLQALRGLVVQMEKRIDNTQAKMEETMKLMVSRMERVTQGFARLETNQNQVQQEVQSRFSQLAGKITERKLTDGKIQEMVDRHGELVRNFENRLVHTQRLLIDQEHQLMNAHAALEEARQELARNKREAGRS